MVKMNKENVWLHTGEAQNGLQIWVQGYKQDGVNYMKVQHRNAEGEKVGKMQDYEISQIRLLNELVDSLEMEYGSG